MKPGWTIVDGKPVYVPPTVNPLQRTVLVAETPQDVVDYMQQRAKEFRQGR